MHSPQLRRGVCPTSIYINYSEFCMGNLSLLPYVFVHSTIYLYLYRLMDIYFIL